MNEIEEVRGAIAARGTAMMAGDIDAIAALLDDRCIYTHSSGLADTRESYIAALRKNEYTYHSVDLVEIDHSIVIDGLVILNSVMEVAMTVRSTGQHLSRQIRVSEVWTRGNGGLGWKLLVSHSTNRS
jgi:ketosteroid isomerase-like protein